VISLRRFGTALMAGMCVLMNHSLGFSQLTQADRNAVVSIGNNWLHLGQEMGWGWTAAGDFSLNAVQEIQYQGELLAFSLPIEGGGYIVVPAYRELPPIIAYSASSPLDVSRDAGFCGMLKEDLKYKIDLVRNYLNNPNPPAEWSALQEAIGQYRSLWQIYAGDYRTFTKSVEEQNRSRAMDSEAETESLYGILDTGPLLTSSWDQGAPYWDLCPMGDGGRCYVGCVATATAQILYYHRSPTYGIGNYTYWWGGDYSCGGSTPGQYLSATFSDAYDWANMVDDYSGGETQAQKDAVAELCYEVGVAEDMDYGHCGSGTYMTDVMEALTAHFGYSNAIDMETRNSYSSGNAWFAMLQAELNQSRPLQYSIYAHSIVCDGWRVGGTNQVHMNYGWDDSHNAWYTVDELYCPWPGCDYRVEDAIRYIIPTGIITVTYPNGGEIWHVDEIDTIHWTSQNYSGNVKISINFSYPGGPWQTIVSSTLNDGSHPWTATIPITTHARIRVIGATSPSTGDTSNADFTIADETIPITVASPNGSEVWLAGEMKNITWVAGGVSGNVKIELNRSYPSGGWETLFASTTNDESEPWLVTSPITDAARVRVSSVAQPAVSDISDADFTINQDNPPVIWHDPKDDGAPGYVLFVAGVSDEIAVDVVRLFWRISGGGAFDSTDMDATGNPDEYAATLSLADAGSYDYYIKARDVGQQVSTTGIYDFQLYPFCGTTISYDDGSAERYSWAGAEEFRWAVRFTPASTPFILCGAKFSVSRISPDSAHSRIFVEVYSESAGFPGTLLFRDTTGSIGNVVGGLPPGQTHWADVVIRDGSGEPLVLYDDFFIAVGNPDTLFYEAFSRDTTSPNSGRSFLYDGCALQWYNENDVWENCKPGDRMVRAVGYYQTPPTVVVYRAGDDAELHWTSTGAPYYRIYSDTTPFGSYGTSEGSTSNTTFVDVGAISTATLKFYRVVSSTVP